MFWALRHPIDWIRSSISYYRHTWGPLWWTCKVCREWRREDKHLLAVAEARMAADTGRRHSLDEVLARSGITRAELEREIEDEED